jgi:cytochrome c
MTSARLLGTAALLAAVTLGSSGIPWAQQEGAGATAEEVVQKVNEAAQHLAEEGEAGLEAFRGKDSRYVWKDSYVVVASCEQDRTVAHPIQPELEGTPMKALTDETGKPFAQELCEATQRPQGGWVEYMWPEPGEREPSRKVSYAKAAEGTPYIVLAGVYDEDATVEELEKVSGGQR